MALLLPPVPIGEDPGSFAWQQWYLQLEKFLGTSGTVGWALIDKTGSSLADIQDRNHADLQNMQGGTTGERYHLTLAQHTDLTDSGDSTIHYHSSDRDRANHTGTQLLSTISDAGTMASQDANSVAITGGSITGTEIYLTQPDGTSQLGQLFMGAGAPDNADGSDGDYYLRTDGSSSTTLYHKESGSWVTVIAASGSGAHNDLSGLQGGTTNEYYHLTLAQHTDLTGSGDSTIHYHASDRNRANHTGTQLASTISDFNEAAQDAVGSILTDSSSIDFTYNDAGGTITASVLPAGVDHGGLAGLADDDHTQYHNDNRALTWLGTRSTSDLAEGTNLYFTDERAQDAVGTILVDSAEIDFTYSDLTPSITASLKAGSIDKTKLDASVNASLSLADSALQSNDIGVTVQAFDADLTTLGGLDKTDGNFIVGNGTTWVVESGATARASLGLGSLATLNSLAHNSTTGLQGGTAGEYYHLTAAEYTALSSSSTTAGTYTPTATAVANITSVTPAVCQYLKVGSIVTVSGTVTVDPATIAAGSATEDCHFGLSLPIASNLANANELAGVGSFIDETATITGDVTNNRASIQWATADDTSRTMSFTFTYRII